MFSRDLDADVKLYVFTCFFGRQDDQWTALAAEASITSCGDSLDDARESLVDAVAQYCSYMIRRGSEERIQRMASKELIRDFQALPEPHCELIALMRVTRGLPAEKGEGAVLALVHSQTAPVACDRDLWETSAKL